MRLAGEIKHGQADGATLDELLDRIKGELTNFGPILELEVVREPEEVEKRGRFAPAELKRRAWMAFSALSRSR